MKRIISLFLLIFMLLGLVACGGGESSSESSATPDVSVSDSENASTEGVSEDESSENVSTEGVSEVESSENVSTEEVSKNETSENTSKDETSDAEISEEVSEEDNGITDDAGYEQFKKVSAVDKLLAERGWKDKGANSDYVPLNYDVMKAMWISQFDFGSIYCSGGTQKPEKEFRALVEKAFDNLVKTGFNTVIVQTRPNADSFYPSAYYPWSQYVVGSYGKFAKYDPLKIMIEEAHERKLSFQAWINPMRGFNSTKVSSIHKSYPISDWSKDTAKRDYLYTYNGLVYLNIAREEVRNNIINAAAELVRNYDVDGVHMDDYFYFGEERGFDQKAYNEARRKNPTISREQFRFENLNLLVSNIYSAIKAENKNVIFGISPAGNIDKMATTYYADVETWLSRYGYVDYIMPQIYFGMEHQTWSFPYTYERWTSIVKNNKIKFMPGITFLKASDGANGIPDQYAGTGKNEWIENKDVMKKCFEYALKQDKFDGFAFFSYTSLWDPQTGAFNTEVQAEWNNCKKYFTEKVIPSKPIKYN